MEHIYVFFKKSPPTYYKHLTSLIMMHSVWIECTPAATCVIMTVHSRASKSTPMMQVHSHAFLCLS